MRPRAASGPVFVQINDDLATRSKQELDVNPDPILLAGQGHLSAIADVLLYPLGKEVICLASRVSSDATHCLREDDITGKLCEAKPVCIKGSPVELVGLFIVFENLWWLGSTTTDVV